MSRKPLLWSFDKPDTFLEKVREIKKQNKAATKRLGEKMNDLAIAKYPNLLCEKKQTKYGEAFVMDIDKSRGLRLSFTLNFREKVIKIIRLGDHKEVYGKDKKK